MADTPAQTPPPRPVEPEVTETLAAEHGLATDEFETLRSAIGRMPTYTELGIVSVMWSEHCSYKSSRAHLGTLPTEGPRVVQGPGENAGVVDIDDGQVVVFKMESHNHPSFIEPYQGAATGVGGICRDVFTMGARPIAIADCLRFGRPEHPRTPFLVAGVVAGIGGYGNAFGVPTVAGDVAFDAGYDGNILVNAFCLGVAERERIFLGHAAGVGNPVLYVGAKTGRDGIHGATMASAEFGEDAQEKRPSVQVGDPFMEKLLLEACLELMQSDVLVGIQDMGAAGLTSSSVEMAARAGAGIVLDLERVPQRERHMTPYELLLSESQERMLMVVHQGREAEALAIFEKWDLDAAVVGQVTDTGHIHVRMHGEVYADLPIPLLAEGLRYRRPMSRPAYLDKTAAFSEVDIEAAEPAALQAALMTLLSSPSIASKAWVYRQYDHDVRHGTAVRPGAADAAVMRVPTPDGARDKGVAITAGCQSRYVYLDPYEGTRLVVAEAYANLVAVGAEPLAVTDCLNFGNPEKPEIMWQLAESIRGMGDALRAFEVPVVSGNVSLYNETDGKAIKPTPMLGMVGLLDDVHQHATMGFARAGEVVAVLGSFTADLAGSSYLELVHEQVAGVPTALDVSAAKATCGAVLALVRGGHLSSAHDVSDGGLAVAIAESAFAAEGGPVGVSLDLPVHPGTRDDSMLFGEAPARFVISYAPEAGDAVRALCQQHGAVLTEIGHTGGDALRIAIDGAPIIDVPVADAHRAYRDSFADAVDR